MLCLCLELHTCAPSLALPDHLPACSPGLWGSFKQILFGTTSHPIELSDSESVYQSGDEELPAASEGALAAFVHCSFADLALVLCTPAAGLIVWCTADEYGVPEGVAHEPPSHQQEHGALGNGLAV